ncbi:MAG: DUF1894 domain-containing protein [Methanomicrobiales archaeon]|nr:DUF1894 domain-containing protein [Methanomicrobiales archaeon]
MACIDELEKEVLLSGASFAECRAYVEGRYTEVYYVDPGYKIFDKHIIGIPPIAVGIEQDSVIFPFTKPCYGTFLLKMESQEEADRMRSLGRRKGTKKSR